MNPPNANQRQFGMEELPLELGTVRGIREWLPMRNDGVLCGLNAYEWMPGENVADCLVPTRDMTDPEHPRPPECGMVGLNCTCGFYAFWQPPESPTIYVIGVIEGWGRTVIGPKGFRCEKARILGLAPKVPVLSDTYMSRWRITLRAAAVYGVPAYPTVRDMLAAHPVKVPDGVPPPGIGDQLLEAMPGDLLQLVLYGFSTAYWAAVGHRVANRLRGLFR